MKEAKTNNAEYQAGATLVDEGIKFTIEKVLFKPVTLTIKPQKPGSIVRISQKISLLEEIKDGTVSEFLGKGKNIEIIAEIIATALVNKRVFSSWKYYWYKWLLLNKVKDLVHLYSYFLLVQRQSSAQFFFHIMNLTPAMNYLKKREKVPENTGAVKPSLAPSDSSKKLSASQTNN